MAPASAPPLRCTSASVAATITMGKSLAKPSAARAQRADQLDGITPAKPAPQQEQGGWTRLGDRRDLLGIVHHDRRQAVREHGFDEPLAETRILDRDEDGLLQQVGRDTCPRRDGSRPSGAPCRRRRQHIDRLAFGGGEHLHCRPRRGHLTAGVVDKLVDLVVVPQRLVMEQREASSAGLTRRRHHRLDRAVTPSHLAGQIFGRGVLRILDHEVGIRQELDVTPILAHQLARVPLRERAAVRLMVGRVHDDHAVHLEAIAERQHRMVQVPRGHPDVADREGALHQLVIADRRRQLIETHGKVRVLHLAGERVAQRFAKAARGEDVPLVARSE